MTRTHLIGLLLGTEDDWPTAFEQYLGRLAPRIDLDGETHEVATERVTIEPFDLRQPVRHALVIDRLAYWYDHPREWLKKIALMDRAYLLNNPFTFQAMEKHAGYCAAIRLGFDVPATWLLPHKVPPENERFAPTASRYNRAFDLSSVGEQVGYPMYHVHRVADLLPHRGEIKGPVVARGGWGEALVLGWDLVGQQPGRGHVEPEPDGGAVAGVLLHRLEGERVVEQVGPVHQGDLLEPFPRVVVPVGEAVDDQGVADGLTQVEGLDGDPLGGHLVGLAVELDARGEPAQVLLERGRPVVLGPEQQADQVGPGHGAPSSDEPRQVVGELGPPGRPVVGHVVAPQVGLVADALLAQQAVEGLGRLERPGGVLPLALTADQQQRQPAPQPVEVVAAEVGHVIHRAVEVDGVAALAPAELAGVVDAALADGQGEQVGPAEGEVGRVEGAEAGPGDQNVERAAAVVVDEGDDLVEDPVLEPAVLDGPGLQGQVGVAPAGRVEAVDRVHLDPAGLDQAGDGVDHAPVLIVGAAALLGLEDEQGAAVVAVGEQPALGPDRGRPQPDVISSHWGTPLGFPRPLRRLTPTAPEAIRPARGQRYRARPPSCGRPGARPGRPASRGRPGRRARPGCRRGSPRPCRRSGWPPTAPPTRRPRRRGRRRTG